MLTANLKRGCSCFSFREFIYVVFFPSIPFYPNRSISVFHTGPWNRKVPFTFSCNLLVSPSTPLFSRHPFFGKDDMNRETGNSNHTVKAFPLNYLVMASFYRHRVYLWTLLKALYLAAVFQRVSPQWIRLPQCLVFLRLSQRRCWYKKAGRILMSAILEMAAAFYLFICLFACLLVCFLPLHQ